MTKTRLFFGRAAVLLALLAGAPVEAENVSVRAGHRAPDFTLRDVEGRPVELSRVLDKKVVLLNFWATWCPPCRVEMPSMERAYREYRGRGLEILAVSVDSGPESVAAQAVERFMLELGLSVPALLDPEMKVAQQYRVLGLPATFLIDRRGMFRSVDVGPRDWFSPASRKKIEEALK